MPKDNTCHEITTPTSNKNSCAQSMLQPLPLCMGLVTPLQNMPRIAFSLYKITHFLKLMVSLQTNNI